MRGPLASPVQGLPRVASTCWWMVDRNEFFQLELFQFERPLARLMAHDFRPCDIGYTRIGVWVADFDRDADATGAPGLTAAQRPARARRGASRVRAQPRRRLRRDHGGRPARGRRARRRADRSAPSPCARSRSRSPTSPGPRPSSRAGSAWSAPTPRCDAPEHEALWGLAGARTRSSVFSRRQRARRARPVPRSGRAAAPGRTTGSRTRASSTSRSALGAGATTRELYRRARAAGARANRRPLHMPGGGVVYVNDPDRFSVELLWMSPASDKRWGFTPRPRRQAAEGGHARRRADGADRRARADHVGCDRRRTRACPSGSVSALSAGPSTAHRSPMAADPSGC